MTKQTAPTIRLVTNPKVDAYYLFSEATALAHRDRPNPSPGTNVKTYAELMESLGIDTENADESPAARIYAVPVSTCQQYTDELLKMPRSKMSWTPKKRAR